VVRASDLRLNGREFDPRPPHCRSISRPTGMGDRLRAGIPPRYVTSHPGQLSLLPSVGREMSTDQSAVMRCASGYQRKDGLFHSWTSPWVAESAFSHNGANNRRQKRFFRDIDIASSLAIYTPKLHAIQLLQRQESLVMRRTESEKNDD